MLKLRTALLSLVACGLAGSAAAVTITFDGLAHGRIVRNQFENMNVSIDATNVGGGPGLAVAFDSNRGFGNSRDDDLQFEGQWSMGNIRNLQLGNLLAIQENGIGCGDGVCNQPDDEGSRPAGTFVLEFDLPVLSFGFDLVDVEDTNMMGGEGNGSITFYDEIEATGGFETVTIPMASALFLEAMGIELGNRSANRITPFLLADLTAMNPFLLEIDRVDINIGGSGGLDNVNFEIIPEPATAGLMALGLAGLGWAGRRRRWTAGAEGERTG